MQEFKSGIKSLLTLVITMAQKELINKNFYLK
jgi:hypothetical protein